MPRGWKSSDYVCPGCKNWNLGHMMRCQTCNHHKPTLNTMGERAREFYPLADQRMHCEGSVNCPECHAIVHISHSECMACRRRKQQAKDFGNPNQVGVLTTATGSKDAERSSAAHGVKFLQNQMALPAPVRERTAVDALMDKYRGVDALAIIDDLEKIKTGSDEPTLEQMEEQRAIKEQEEKEKEREKERERKRKLAEEQAKKDLEVAKLTAIAMDFDKKRKREEAQDRIAAMLDRDEAEEAGAVPTSEAASEAPSAATDAADEEKQKQERKAELLRQAEELKKKQEDIKKKKEAEEEERRKRMRERRAQNAVTQDAEEEERRKRMRERRAQRAGKAAPAATDAPVVLDD